MVFCGRRENLGRELEDQVRSNKGEALYVRADVRVEDDVRNLIATTAHRSAYTASKRGLVGLVQSAALDYVSQNIRINALIPGTTDTPLVCRAGAQLVIDGGKTAQAG